MRRKVVKCYLWLSWYGKFHSVAPIADEINVQDTLLVMNSTMMIGVRDVIPLEISDLSKTNTQEEYLQVLSPFGNGQEKTRISIEGLVIHDTCKRLF